MGWPKGKKHSEETRKKMSLNNRGKNNPFYRKKHSKKTIILLSQKGKARARLLDSKERKKISEKISEAIKKPEVKKRMKKGWDKFRKNPKKFNAWKRKISSPERNKKISLNKTKEWANPKSIYNSKAYRKKLRDGWIDRVVSEETKKKMSKAHKNRTFSEEHIKKNSEGVKRAWKNPNSKLNSKERNIKLSNFQKELWKNPRYKQKRVGKNSKLWLGGIFPYGYGSNWKKQQKKIINKCDGVCEICLKTIKKRKLEVHHIKPFRVFLIEYIKKNKKNVEGKKIADIVDLFSYKANKLSNLIGLCKSCHRKCESLSRKKFASTFKIVKTKKDLIHYLKEHKIILSKRL